MNTFSNSTLISSFPSKTVTTINVNSLVATISPNSLPGFSTTYIVDNVFDRQEHRLYRPNSIYSRYELADET